MLYHISVMIVGMSSTCVTSAVPNQGNGVMQVFTGNTQERKQTMKSHIAITFGLELSEGWNEDWWEDFKSKVGGAIVNFTYPRGLSFEHDETGETLADRKSVV